MNQRNYDRYSASRACQWRLGADWHVGHVRDVSASGASIRSKKIPEIGEIILFKTDWVGIIWGNVVRCQEESFAVSFDPHEAKKMGINDLITALLNKGELSPEDLA